MKFKIYPKKISVFIKMNHDFYNSHPKKGWYWEEILFLPDRNTKFII
jgi:hypothetical protein